MTAKEIIGNKSYKAIFFDWDGTAVMNRNSAPDHVAACMRPLLDRSIKLIIISGTTWNKIFGGVLDSFFTSKQLHNLYLGLGRGAFDYGFDDAGNLVLLHDELYDSTEKKLMVDTAAWELHKLLFSQFGLNTDIIFSRPNYCKIDLMVENERGNALYMQENENENLHRLLETHNIKGGIKTLFELTQDIAQKAGLRLYATCDAKYLELGMSTKSSNVNYFMDMLRVKYNILAEDCCFWGDEFREIDNGIMGSDAQMITKKTQGADFFDVSGVKGNFPAGVRALEGKSKCFCAFLKSQAKILYDPENNFNL